MKTRTVLGPSIVGTSAMTLFSYLIAASKDRQLEEPKLLAKLIKPVLKHRYKTFVPAIGWGAHYTMGYMMTQAFQAFWKENNTVPTVKDGLISGTVGGITGILIWKAVFKICAHTPHIAFKRYYGHLLLAHLVFGVAVGLTTRLVDPFKSRRPKKIKEVHT